jgi:hypothetical protein
VSLYALVTAPTVGTIFPVLHFSSSALRYQPSCSGVAGDHIPSFLANGGALEVNP